MGFLMPRAVLCPDSSLFPFGELMKKVIWIFVLRWIERSYAGSDKPWSSEVVDCCLFIKEHINSKGDK